MALRIAEIKEQIIVTLYDYMLSSDHETYWYSLPKIKEAMDPSVSGAMMRISLKALVDEEIIEDGFDDDAYEDIYALTEAGVVDAETYISARGVEIREYSPAPSSDRILSRIDEMAQFQGIQDALKEIGQQIRENNSVGVALGDDKDIIATEIAAAELIVSKDRFRLQRLVALIIPALRFMADKFVGSALGETAKRLIKLLLES